MKQILNSQYNNLQDVATNYKEQYSLNNPFPHIILDDFFEVTFLNKILNNFPVNLEKDGLVYESNQEKKLASQKANFFKDESSDLINFLNSYEFLIFLKNLTNIKEPLIPDPYLWGGGYHELRNNGHLNIHADFNLHPELKINRRINLLIYLNKEWNEKFGGSLELWDKKMEKCVKKILPSFNRIVIFNTNDFSFHGNPQKINHPKKISRKSIALYYYTNGRPKSEVQEQNEHTTLFQKRPGTSDKVSKGVQFKKMFGKFYIRTKIK